MASGTGLDGDFDGSGAVDFNDMANLAYFWLQPASNISICVPSVAHTIQQAVNYAHNGDTIIVAPGTYHESINLGTKNVILRSRDPNDPCSVNQTVIDATGNSNGILLKGGAQIIGLKIINSTSYGVYYCPDVPPSAGPLIKNCLISNTHIGMYFYQDIANGVQSVIQHCNIYRNTWDGIDIHAGYNSSARFSIIDCNITSNKNYGISCSTSYPITGQIQGTSIISNGNDGFFDGPDNFVSFLNCVIAKNGSGNSSAGIVLGNAGHNAQIQNCTIYGNKNYGIMTGSSGSFTILNSIIWGNPSGLCNIPMLGPISYCCIDGTTQGLGMLYKNPLFVSTDSNNFYLSQYSPCIDTGAPWSAYSNEPAPNGGRINMGAYGNTSQAECTTDTTGDGISDGWKKAFWPSDSPSLHPASADQDNDGFTNWAEYLFGYNPTQTTIDTSTIKYVWLSTPQFDPTAGGYIDITSWVNRTTTLTVTIKEKISQTQVFSTTLSASVGGNNFRWYGRDAQNLIVKDANYTITVGANDNNGHVDTYNAPGTVLITYPQRITNLQSNPYRIIPANNEVATITYNISCDADMCVDVYAPDGTLYTTLLSSVHQLASQNPQSVVWSGRDVVTNRTIRKEGAYTVKVRFSGMNEQQTCTVSAYK
jgi:hypothetical protein